MPRDLRRPGQDHHCKVWGFADHARGSYKALGWNRQGSLAADGECLMILTAWPAAFAFMLGGVVLGLIGVVVTGLSRRQGVTWSTLFWAGSTAAAHPERYVKPERVVTVRRINHLAVSLFLVGVLILVARSVIQSL